MGAAGSAGALRRRTSFAAGAATVLLAAMALVVIPAAPALAQPFPPATSAYRAVGPVRVLDTRTRGGTPLPAGSTVDVPIRSVAGVPAGAVAAAVTLAAADVLRPGFVTAWGDGARPQTSSLNLDAAGQTRTNFAIVPIAADGTIHLYTHAGGALVVDLTGVFVRTDASRAGRFVGVGPARLVDTRLQRAPLAPGEVRTIDVTPVGVPARADAVVVSFTGVGQRGWFAAWRAGDAWPGTSTVDVADASTPATATSIVPVRDGRIAVTSWRGGDVVIDVTGYMTGADAPSSSEGLFVPSAPTRLYDSREPASGGRPLGGGTTITERVPNADVAAALATSITAVDVETPGLMTVFAARAPMPGTANVSVARGQTVATGAITPNSSGGTNVFTLGTAHVVIDVSGWFTTAARVAPTPTADAAPVAATAPAPPGSFEFAMVGADGTIARWDPCSTVEVWVDFTDAHAGARDALAAALLQATLATGLSFRVHETDSREERHGTGTLTVLWQHRSEQPAFRDGTIGIGGGALGGGEIVEGWMYLDADSTVDVPGTERRLLLDLMLHELGHALGLAHVADETQVMFPFVSERGTYQQGDLAGLAALGMANGCTSARTMRAGFGADAHPASDHDHATEPLQVFESP